MSRTQISVVIGRVSMFERAWFVSDVKSGVAMFTGFPLLRRNIFPLRKIAPTDESTEMNI
jgi:hypothetical protein